MKAANGLQAGAKNGTQVKKLTIIEIIEAKTSAFPLAEFAVLYSIDYGTAWDMVKSGRLPAMRIGGSWRLDPATTAEWLRQRSSA